MTSDTGIKALTTGLRAKPGSPAAAAAITRLISIADRLQKQKRIVESKKQQTTQRQQETQQFRQLSR